MVSKRHDSSQLSKLAQGKCEPNPPSLSSPTSAEKLAHSIDRLSAAIERLLERLPAPEPAPARLGSPRLDATPPADFGLPSVRQLLESIGLRIKGLALPKESERPLCQLAWFLGTRHDTLRDLLHKIKRAMNNGLRLSHDLDGLGSDEVSTHCQFVSLARDQRLLANFQYVRTPRRVQHVVCSRDPSALNFFSGSWLERYLEESLRKAQPGVVEVQRSLHVLLPTGEGFELDIVVKDRSGRLIWVEAKTGEYTGSIPKCARVRQILNLPADRAILVLPEVNAAVCENLGPHYGLRAVNLSGWEELARSLAAPLAAQPRF